MTAPKTGDLTFTATWKVVEYTITYVDGVQAGSASTTVVNPNATRTKYTIEESFTLEDASREGYTFLGWAEGDTVTAPKTGDLTFTATWKVIEYEITYVNGVQAGSVSTTVVNTNPIKYTIEQSFALSDASRTGYTFVAWEDTESNLIAKISAGTTGDKTFIATWEVVEYAIIYELNGGTNASSNPASYTVETTTITLTDPTKTGYLFLGWYSTSTFDAGTEVTEITLGSTEDVNLYASFILDEFTITFDTAGGSVVAAITDKYNAAITKPADPTKTGYTFAGWSPEVPTTMPAEDITVTAQWTINQYTITFDTAGGSSVAAITQDYNTAVTSPSDPTKAGYTFNGWDTTIPATMPAENITVTAQWTLDEYTITYNLDSGTNSASNPATYTVETTTFTLVDPTRTGYNFLGWFTDSGCTVAADTTIEKGSTGNLTFYASWEEQQEYEYTKSGSAITITKINDVAGESVIIPSEIDGVPVTTIDSNVIAGNSTVKEITIPASVITINSLAFSGGLEFKVVETYEEKEIERVVKTDSDLSTNLLNIYVDDANTNFKSVDGVLYSKDGYILRAYPNGRTDSSYTIQDGVTQISAGAFAGNVSLTKVTIPAGFKIFGSGAFMDCENLTDITIPRGFNRIGYSAFEGCKKLGGTGSNFAFEDPSNTTGISSCIIGSFAFTNTGFTEFNVPKYVSRIDRKAFAFDNAYVPISQINFYLDSYTSVSNVASSTSECKGWNLKYTENLTNETITHTTNLG